jgi:hypothetical protein
MLHKLIITFTAGLIAVSAVAELLFPLKLLEFVGLTSNPQLDFLLRTTGVTLVALLPSLWIAWDNAYALLGKAVFVILSSAVDFQAFTQGIVNLWSVPSIVIRVTWGMSILWLMMRSITK